MYTINVMKLEFQLQAIILFVGPMFRPAINIIITVTIYGNTRLWIRLQIPQLSKRLLHTINIYK